MIIVGELINASRKKIAAAIESQDTEVIQTIAKDQHEHGANYIDVNAGVFVGKEPEYLQWLTSTVQAAVDTPCCIDSPDPKAIESALTVHKGTPMINSISLEKDRYEALLPIVAGASGFGWAFWAVLVLIATLVIRQHSLVRPDDLDRVNQAFFDTNAAISLTLLLAGTIDCFWV